MFSSSSLKYFTTVTININKLKDFKENSTIISPFTIRPNTHTSNHKSENFPTKHANFRFAHKPNNFIDTTQNQIHHPNNLKSHQPIKSKTTTVQPSQRSSKRVKVAKAFGLSAVGFLCDRPEAILIFIVNNYSCRHRGLHRVSRL